MRKISNICLKFEIGCSRTKAKANVQNMIQSRMNFLGETKTENKKINVLWCFVWQTGVVCRCASGILMHVCVPICCCAI